MLACKCRVLLDDVGVILKLAEMLLVESNARTLYLNDDAAEILLIARV